jgi:hypothetical protein
VEIYALGIALLAVFVLNWTAVGMMAVAFGIIIHRGGWKAAVLPDDASWTPARKLMASGAGIGVIVCILYLVLFAVAERLLD